MNPVTDINPNNQNTNQESSKAEVPQLQNETPMDITIYPSNENPEVSIEPQKIQSQPLISEESKPEALESIAPIDSITPKQPTINPITFDTPVEATVTATPTSLPLMGTLNTSLINQNNSIESNFAPITQAKPVVEYSSNTQNESIPSAPQPTQPNTETVQNPIPSEIPNSSVNSGLPNENFLQNPTNQKIAIIGGIILGLFLVAGVFLFVFNGSKNVLIDKKDTTTANQPAPVLTNLTANPPAIKQEIPVMSLADYQTRISDVYNKYQTLISSNQLNLVGNNLNLQTLKFVGDEIFALQSEVSQYNVAPEIKVYNNKVLAELYVLVSNYDDLLKSYKLSGNLTPEMKAKFLTSTKNSTEKLKIVVEEIRALK